MNIIKTLEGDTLQLALAGRLDTTTSQNLKQVIEDETEKVNRLLMDLEQLEYISSAGLRVLLSTHKKMKSVGGEMLVKHVGPTVQEVFKITGFDKILNIE